jgi:uroporphyrinogen decarboxylase
MTCKALSRGDVFNVIEGIKKAPRVPVLLHQWTNSGAFSDPKDQAAVASLLTEFPQDAQVIWWRNCNIYDPPEDDPTYCWIKNKKAGTSGSSALDSHIAIENWDHLDELLANFPSSSYKGLFPNPPAPDGRYRIAHWWYTLFERHWSLRGMDNALTDFYMYPEETHKLYRAFTDFYLGIIRRAKEELGADAVYTTDDLGTQNGLFFGSDIFAEFFYPYYAEMIAEAHRLGMHFWLHSCGNVTSILPDLIRMKLDVLHPIQKYAMDEKEIAAQYGDKICVWAGFDVQKVIPYGTVDDVRAEVRHLYDTYSRPQGKFMFTAGNGITGDTPVASLRALFEEAYSYQSQ